MIECPFVRPRTAIPNARAELPVLAFDFQAYLAASGLPSDTPPPLTISLGRNDTAPRV